MSADFYITLAVNAGILILTVGGVAMKFTERISKLEAHQQDMKDDREEIKASLKDIQARVPPPNYFEDLMARIRHLEEKNR